MDSNSFSVSSILDTTGILKELCTLIKSVKKDGDATTLDDVWIGLRDYIWEKQLFDAKQMKVLCKGDALAKIFGVDEFTILEMKKLLQGFMFHRHSNERVLDNQTPEKTSSKDTSTIPFRDTAGAKRNSEEMFEVTKVETQKRHCEYSEKTHTECSETSVGVPTHLKQNAESPMFLHIPASPIESSSDSSYSVQCVETSFVTDSSDESIYFHEDSINRDHFLPSGSILTIAETFEVEFEPNTNSEMDSLCSDCDSSEWDSIMDMDSIITFVCKTDDDQEFWADGSDEEPEIISSKSSEDDIFDAEISEFDLWRCSGCKKLNNPPNRFCLKCFQTREGWLPEKTPVSEKIPIKRKPRPPRRKKRLQKKKGRYSSKYFKEDSLKSFDLPSTSQDKSPSHEDIILDSEKSKISLGKINDKKKLCLVCCDKPVNSCIVHGKIAHAIACYHCSKQFKRCPVCRRTIEKVVYLISS